MSDEQHYLVVLSDAASLAWVLSQQRMAFPLARRRMVEQIEVGDWLYLYTARDCFGNPGRDRSRIMAVARTVGPVVELDEPITVARRQFHFRCDLELRKVAPPRQGVEVAPLIDKLETFSNKRHWSARLRQPPVRLEGDDPKIISERLRMIVEPLERHLAVYKSLGSPHT